MMNRYVPLLVILCFTGCATVDVKDYSALEVKSNQPEAFNEIEYLAVELLDEVRLLSKTRSAKAVASKPVEQRKAEIALSTYQYDGFDRVTTWSCDCEITTVMKGVAERVGWGSERVFIYGTPPPGGIFVQVNLNNRPIQDVLKIVDSQKGSQVDVNINTTLRTIIVKYIEKS
ncbi:hypothetical protein FG475_15195 [Vibrio navarrensis]|nr:hypothetical protein [Vibrio navarrensis]HDY8121374.1 hypothetical protein [Vibrio vulnificus]